MESACCFVKVIIRHFNSIFVPATSRPLANIRDGGWRLSLVSRTQQRWMDYWAENPEQRQKFLAKHGQSTPEHLYKPSALERAPYSLILPQFLRQIPHVQDSKGVQGAPQIMVCTRHRSAGLSEAHTGLMSWKLDVDLVFCVNTTSNIDCQPASRSAVTADAARLKAPAAG